MSQTQLALRLLPEQSRSQLDITSPTTVRRDERRQQRREERKQQTITIGWSPTRPSPGRERTSYSASPMRNKTTSSSSSPGRQAEEDSEDKNTLSTNWNAPSSTRISPSSLASPSSIVSNTSNPNPKPPQNPTAILTISTSPPEGALPLTSTNLRVCEYVQEFSMKCEIQRASQEQKSASAPSESAWALNVFVDCKGTRHMWYTANVS